MIIEDDDEGQGASGVRRVRDDLEQGASMRLDSQNGARMDRKVKFNG